MFFVVSKILKVFILPLTWILGLLVLSYWVKDKRWRKRLFIVAICMLVLFSNKPLLQWAQYMTTRQYSHQKMPKKYYEVAIVLGGFSSCPIDTANVQLNYIDDRGARLWEALRLYEAGIVEKILITGDATISIDRKGNTTAEAMKQYLNDFGIHEGDLILEQKARNTRDNAELSIALLDSLGHQADKCLLVTSASHLKRAQACFSTLGWSMDCYATNIYPRPHLEWKSFIPSWKTLTDWHELMNEWMGVMGYRIVGY